MRVNQIDIDEPKLQILEHAILHRGHKESIGSKGRYIVCTRCGDQVLGSVVGPVSLKDLNYLYHIEGLKDRRCKNIAEAVKQMKIEIDRQVIREGVRNVGLLDYYAKIYRGRTVYILGQEGEVIGLFIEIGKERVGMDAQGRIRVLPTNGYQRMGKIERGLEGRRKIGRVNQNITASQIMLISMTVIDLKYKGKWYPLKYVESEHELLVDGGAIAGLRRKESKNHVTVEGALIPIKETEGIRVRLS